MSFPKTLPGLGSRLAFWRRGLGARSAGQCPSLAGSSPLVYAKRSFFAKCSLVYGHFAVTRSSRGALAYAKRSFSTNMSLSSTRNGHFAVTCSSRGTLAYAKQSFSMNMSLSSTRKGHFPVHCSSRGALACAKCILSTKVSFSSYAKRTFCRPPFVPRRSCLRAAIIFNGLIYA